MNNYFLQKGGKSEYLMDLTVMIICKAIVTLMIAMNGHKKIKKKKKVRKNSLNVNYSHLHIQEWMTPYHDDDSPSQYTNWQQTLHQFEWSFRDCKIFIPFQT